MNYDRGRDHLGCAQPVPLIFGLVEFSAHNPREGVGLKAVPADQGPIHIGFRRQSVNIVGSNAPAVKDADGSSSVVTIGVSQQLTNRAVDSLSLFGSSVAAGADSP